jgi:ABC-type transporter Mla subunit MlaD
MSQNISAATEEQSTNAKHVSKAIEDINGVVQDSAASAEAVSQSTGQLAEMAKQLRGLIAQFKTEKAEKEAGGAEPGKEEVVRELPEPQTIDMRFGIQEKKKQPAGESQPARR